MYPSLVLKALYRIFSGFATKNGCRSIDPAFDPHYDIKDRQPGWAGDVSLCGYFFGFEAYPFGFPIVVPIQALPAAVAVGHKLPIQELLAPGTAVINIIFFRKTGENLHIFYFHRNTVRQHQLKTDRKISQSAGPLPLSDCHNLRSFSFVVFFSVYLWHCFSGLYRSNIVLTSPHAQA